MTVRGRKWYSRCFWSAIPRWGVPWADPCEDPHPTVTIQGIAVDAEVAPLVMELWRQGIDTYNSCQGDERLYRLWESRHPAESWPGGNPYSGYVTVGSVAAARRVVRILEPSSDRPAAISTRCGDIEHGEWWFVDFHPAALRCLPTSSARSTPPVNN